MTNHQHQHTAALLRWLSESGADEIISDAPVNNFAPPPASEKVEAIAGPLTQRRAGHAPPASPARPQIVTALNPEPVSIQSARDIAMACHTLDELKEALCNFKGCELKRFAKNTVFADGAPDAPLMFVGEAPGRDEDEQGVPFVGRAGQLLDRMLAAARLDRGKVYITNVLNWRPPQNRDPTPEEAAICLPFVQRHIELKAPEVLVLLGAVAVRHILGLGDGIMRLRGNWNMYQSGSVAIPVMPTLHPAYLLRQPSAKRLAWRDMLAVLKRLSR
jgi:DNA polymerase